MENRNITILMTVYNGARYLMHAIESVLGQTYRDFEFLIVNDGSTDNSLDIINSFNDKRIIVHNNEENIGQTKSLNIGLNLAKGEYIARLDADDIAFPGWLNSQVEFLRKNSHYDVISAGVVIINSRDQIKRLYASPSNKQDIILRSIINSPINHGSSLIRKELVLSVGGYDEKYRVTADYALWLKLLAINAKITSNPAFLMAVRWHDDSISQQGRSGQVIAELAQIIRENIVYVSGLHLSEGDSTIFCRAHYDGGFLTLKEFIKALQIHAHIFVNLKPSLELDTKTVKCWKNRQTKAFYNRRIYYLISQGNIKEAREIAFLALKEFGWFSSFMILFLGSFLGIIFLKSVPFFYTKIHKLKAFLRMRLKTA